LVELNMNKNELLDYCSKLSKKENIEFYYQENNLEKSNIEKFSVGKNSYKESSALLIKVLINGQIGEYTLNKFTVKNILTGIKKAKNIAKLKNNLKIKNFGSSKSKTKIKFDKDIENICFEKLIEDTKKELTKDKYIKSYEGSISKVNNYNFYINPYFEKENKNTCINISTHINTKFKKPSSGGFSSIFTKTKDIDINNNITQAKINANNLLNPKQGIKDKYTLIFIPELIEEIFEELIVPATIGETIFKKESYLYNLKNKEVFSKNINLVEKPHLDYFLGSQSIDDEGYKTTNKNIINKGNSVKDIMVKQLKLEAEDSKTVLRGGWETEVDTSGLRGMGYVLEGKLRTEVGLKSTKEGMEDIYGQTHLDTPTFFNEQRKAKYEFQEMNYNYDASVKYRFLPEKNIITKAVSVETNNPTK